MITYPDVLSVTETIELSRIIARPFARIASALGGGPHPAGASTGPVPT